jgi:hypothetical protein
MGYDQENADLIGRIVSLDTTPQSINENLRLNAFIDLSC